MFGCLMGWYTIYTFLGVLAPDGIVPGAKFTLCPSLAFSYIGSITAWHWAFQQRASDKLCGVGTRNGITEVSQRAPPIFGWAAITF